MTDRVIVRRGAYYDSVTLMLVSRAAATATGDEVSVGMATPLNLELLANPSLVPFKSGVRAFIESAGYRILVNVGDQFSDLAGGFARRSIKLNNPIYVTP